jgi:NADH dehydrogenase (ubiquinone) Fe-S protein 3
MNNLLLSFAESIVCKLPNVVKSFVYANEELTFNVDYRHVDKALFFFKNHSTSQFKVLVDMTAVDYPNKSSRFEIVYHLLSISFNVRVRLKVCLNELSSIETASFLYSSAGWAEREI